MAGLADDWQANRQTCVDVLCAYLRMPYEPDPGKEASVPDKLAYRSSREVRHTVIRVITAHLKEGAAVPWQGLSFDFTGTVFDGGSIDKAVFSGGTVDFSNAKFPGGSIFFRDAKFSGSTILFRFARFSGGLLYFNFAQFSGGVINFLGAHFSSGSVHFEDAQFSGSTIDFSLAGEWSSPPSFKWGTSLSGVKLPEGRDPYFPPILVIPSKSS